jgi:hypothetical protein
MTPKAKKLLDIVKRPTSATPERKVGGTDPSDPWSATSKISESPSLNKYLMSRGFDPKHITKDIKVAHSKSNQFKLWQQHHMREDLTTKHTGAGVDHKTDLSVSPTKKRLNTLVKAKAHYNIPTPPGTMRKEDVELNEDDYFGKDASDMIKKSHEHHAAAQVAKNKGDHAEHERLSKLSSDTHKAAMAKAKEYRENPKNKASVERGINKNMSGAAKDYGKGRYMGDSVELDGDQLDEISLGDYKQKAQAQTKELKKHTKGEYGGIAQRMLDRRNKGLKMVSKREHKIETSSDVTEGAPIIVMPSHKRLEKKHKPSLSHGMDPAKAQGEQDARDGKPYNNPYPFKKELGAPGNWEHNSYKASYDSVKQGVAEGSISDLLNKDPTSPKFNDHSAPRKTKHSGSTPTPYEQGRLDAHRKKSYNNIHNSEQDAEDYKTGYRHVKSRQGVAEGAAELLKQEMPLVRHIEQELAQHGYEKGTPEYDQMFKHAIAIYRKFGNVDAIKQGVAEEKKDSRSASEKMSDYAVKRHKVYQGIANKQKELMKKWNDDHKDEPHLQVTIPEDVGSPMAAIKGVPVPESMAQKIKAMYKKKVVEDTYDSEKDDKYGQNSTFGKKPVMKSIDNKSDRNVDGVKTKAAAVLTGGTTLTGQKRDTVQIDPQLNNPRPGQTDPNGDRSNK